MVAPNQYKRKGDDILSQSTAFSSRSVASVRLPPSLDETRAALQSWKLELELEEEDSVLKSFLSYKKKEQEVVQEQEVIETSSKEILSKIETKLQKALATYKNEAELLYQLQVAYNELKCSRDNMMQECEEVDQKIHDIQSQIVQYQKIAEEEFDMSELFEAERKLKAPRLRQQISLYGNISGIKWDFDQERVLAGHIVSGIS
jgi:hypothetical protein